MPVGYTGFTIDQLNTLNAAIMGGTRSVYYGDKRVEYRSLGEMYQIRRMAMLELGLTNQGSGTSFAEFDKGIRRKCNDNPDFDNSDSHWNQWM